MSQDQQDLQDLTLSTVIKLFKDKQFSLTPVFDHDILVNGWHNYVVDSNGRGFSSRHNVRHNTKICNFIGDASRFANSQGYMPSTAIRPTFAITQADAEENLTLAIADTEELVSNFLESKREDTELYQFIQDKYFAFCILIFLDPDKLIQLEALSRRRMEFKPVQKMWFGKHITHNEEHDELLHLAFSMLSTKQGHETDMLAEKVSAYQSPDDTEKSIDF